MLVQVQSSLSLEQYSCSVKVRLYSKACSITGCTAVLVLVTGVLAALETSYIYLTSIGGSAMVAMFFLVHHRSEYPPSYTTSELRVTSMRVVNVLWLLPGCSLSYRPLPCCSQVAVDCGIFRGFRFDHVKLFKYKSLGHLFFRCLYVSRVGG